MSAWEVADLWQRGAFDVVGQETNPEEVFFKPDGTKMYIVGTSNDRVYQYSLSVPWEVSTASYDGASFTVATQESNPRGLFFKPDGTKMYVVGSTNDTVYQYTLSTAWAVNTASYDSVSFSVATQETLPYGLFFKPDGTKMYVIGDTDSIYQYSLSTAWVVSSASYDSVSFSVTTQDTSPKSVFFKPDGSKLYIVGTTDTVYQYSLSTAWVVSTASYDSISFSITSQEQTPGGLFFDPDGTKMYIIGFSSDTVFQYSLSTAWDISNTRFDTPSHSIVAQETSSSGLYFKPDGLKMYVVGFGLDRVYQYSLSTAWDLNTASYDSISILVSGQDTSPQDLFFKSDGSKMYVIGATNDTIYQYSLSTAWDLSTASYDSVSFSIAAQETSPEGLFFKSDGSKMYVIGTTNDTVYQYTLTTAWDLSTASYDSVSFSVATQELSPVSLFFKSDGTKLYVIGFTSDTIYQYSLSTAWNVSTASYDNVSFGVRSFETNPSALFIRDDGLRLFFAGRTSDSVIELLFKVAPDAPTPDLPADAATIFDNQSKTFQFDVVDVGS